jgi:hypothetical protein
VATWWKERAEVAAQLSSDGGAEPPSDLGRASLTWVGLEDGRIVYDVDR